MAEARSSPTTPTILIPPGRSPPVNATYLQSFASYTFPTQTTFAIRTESTNQWTAPVMACVSQVLKIGGQPISVSVMGKYYAVRPDGAPAWGVRVVLTLLFPK